MSFFLSCDAMLSPNCTVGDYVIEWRWNSRTGTPVFISGYGTDPDIQAQHPFTNEVVLAGTLYPVIRYAYLNGQKYTSSYEDGALFSPDFVDCFDPVVVEAVNCSSVLGADPIYPYSLVYVNNVDGGANKSRLVKYDISVDTYYIAWQFEAQTVADQLKIYYCTLADPDGVLLENFISGINYVVNNYYPTNYPTNPKITTSFTGGTAPLAMVTPLNAFTYQVGDYIKIEIIGSVYEPTVTNTNWAIRIKCLTVDGLDCSTFIADTGMSKITSTPVFTYEGDPTCAYKISYSTLDSPFVSLPARSSSSNTLFRYFSGFYYWYGPTGGNYFGQSYASPVVEGLLWNTTASVYTAHNSVGFNTCMNMQPGQTITTTKSGVDVVFTFTDITDYNKYVSDIADFKASANYIFWQGLDGTDSRYYATFRIHSIIATSCGDISSNYYYYFFFGAPIAYDSVAKTITITCDIPTNIFVDSDCDSTYEQIVNAISVLNGTRNETIGTPRVTSSRNVGTIAAYWVYYAVTHQTSREIGFGISIEDGLTNNICDLAALGFCKGLLPGNPNVWVLPKYYDRLSFTDPSTHETRMCTWKLERKVVLRTDVCADTAYEVVAQGECTTTTTTTSTSTSSTTTTTTTVIPQGLEITYDDIANASVADPYDVSQWNTLFNLPTNGSVFTSVNVTGAVVTLYGGGGMSFNSALYSNSSVLKVKDNNSIVITALDYCLGGNANINEIYMPALQTAGAYSFPSCPSMAAFDFPLLTSAGENCFSGNSATTFSFASLTTIGSNCFANNTQATSYYLPLLTTATGNYNFANNTSVTAFSLPEAVTLQYGAFYGCTGATSFNLPKVTLVGDSTFEGCGPAVTSIYLPLCTTLGSSVLNNYVFGFSGATVTVTIPASIMTCNGGNPDGDITYLSANNTETIVTV